MSRSRKVVWAIQSPTLLNILARGPWDMYAADLGDTETLGGLGQLAVPQWDGAAEGVAAVFACSPAHVENARRLLPTVPIVLVAHQAYSQKLPPCDGCTHVICFSESVRYYVRRGLANASVAQASTRWFDKIREVRCIRPCFECRPVWKWAPGQPWSMMDRPQTREPIAAAPLLTIKQRASVDIRIYGQDQAAGMLDAEAKARLFASSSCYVSAMHARAGVGLAEHEAIAAGCPVVGVRWGDFLLSHAAGVQGMLEFADLFEIAQLVDRVCIEGDLARTIANTQVEFLHRSHTLERMTLDIDRVMDDTI